MQTKQDSNASAQDLLNAEKAAHSETRSKLVSAKQAIERKTALVSDYSSRLEHAQQEAAKGTSSVQALTRAEQQLKEANTALSRKEAKLREVWCRLVYLPFLILTADIGCYCMNKETLAAGA